MIFDKESHEKLVHTWGNLVPLSAKMNQSLSQSDYENKKVAFKADSMFASTRKLANEYLFWTAESIKQRSTAISEWAMQRWKK
jgi:hypothetical protein